MLDTAYIIEIRAKLLKKLDDEKALLFKSEANKKQTLEEDKKEHERVIHYGNVKYLEGQIDILNSILSLYV